MYDAGYPFTQEDPAASRSGFSAKIIFWGGPYHFFYPGYIIAPSPKKDVSERIQKTRPERFFEGKARAGNSDPHRPDCNEHI